MKNLLFLFAVIAAVVILSCKKQADGPGEIYGTWKLTESYADPGDGSGKYEKVKGDPLYITFDKSGNVSGSAVPDFAKFKIIDSARIEFTRSNNQTVNFRYKVSALSLTLNPPCYEGCGSRFVRN